jgi:hypothetical protein
MHLKEVANFGPKLTTFRPQDPKPLAKPFEAKAKAIGKAIQGQSQSHWQSHSRPKPKPLAKPFKAKAKAIGKAIQGFAKIHPIKEATFPLQIIPPSGINLSHGSLMTE